MRRLTSHVVNGLNEAIEITVLDEPGQGGACHEYRLNIPTDTSGLEPLVIKFQNGPLKEEGTNGFSGEALLAVVEDRLLCFQAGPYACRENAVALTKLQEALMWLQKRTRDRMARGVEGTNAK